MKGISVFNAAQTGYCAFLASFLADGSPEKAKAKERPPADPLVGACVNVVFVNNVLEKGVKKELKERILRKYLASQLPQNKNKTIAELREMRFKEKIIFLTYSYYRAKKELPNWRRILKAPADASIILKEDLMNFVKAEFKAILTHEELSKALDSFAKLNKGKPLVQPVDEIDMYLFEEMSLQEEAKAPELMLSKSFFIAELLDEYNLWLESKREKLKGAFTSSAMNLDEFERLAQGMCPNVPKEDIPYLFIEVETLPV